VVPALDLLDAALGGNGSAGAADEAINLSDHIGVALQFEFRSGLPGAFVQGG
jgi:hypothetical protein